MDTNAYLAKQYPAPPCWNLVADVYATELAQGVLDYQVVNPSVRSIASAFRLALHKSAHGFAPLTEPRDLCVVLLGRTHALGPHHCGIFYEGKVLHAMPSGVMLEDLTVLTDSYQLVEFWGKPE